MQPLKRNRSTRGMRSSTDDKTSIKAGFEKRSGVDLVEATGIQLAGNQQPFHPSTRRRLSCVLCRCICSSIRHGPAAQPKDTRPLGRAV